MNFNVEFVLELINYTSLKRFYLFQVNPKKCLHNTTFSLKLSYIAGVTLYIKKYTEGNM